jgi:hypothetical protein
MRIGNVFQKAFAKILAAMPAKGNVTLTVEEDRAYLSARESIGPSYDCVEVYEIRDLTGCIWGPLEPGSIQLPTEKLLAVCRASANAQNLTLESVARHVTICRRKARHEIGTPDVELEQALGSGPGTEKTRVEEIDDKGERWLIDGEILQDLRIATVGLKPIGASATWDLITPHKAAEPINVEPPLAEIGLRAGEILEALARVEPCMSTERASYTSPDYSKAAEGVVIEPKRIGAYRLDGIAIALNKDGVAFIATDGKQLAECRVDLRWGDAEGKALCIIQRPALKALRKFLEAHDPKLTIGVALGKDHVVFSGPDNRLVISQPKAKDWRYPRYGDVWPLNGPDNRVTVYLESLARAVKALKTHIDPESPHVGLAIVGQTGVIHRNSGPGETIVEFEIDHPANDTPIAGVFSLKYLEQFLKLAGKARSARLCFYGKDAPIVLDQFSDRTRYALMPCDSTERSDVKAAAQRRAKKAAAGNKAAAAPLPDRTKDVVVLSPHPSPAPQPQPASPVPQKAKRIASRKPDVAAHSAGADTFELPPEREPCLNCGTTRGGLTTAKKYERSKGRCQACYNYFRTHQNDRKEKVAV